MSMPVLFCKVECTNSNSLVSQQYHNTGLLGNDRSTEKQLVSTCFIINAES